MNRFNLLFLAFATTLLALTYASHAEKESLVMSNRTPKLASMYTDACDECQTIIKRIVQIAKDPTKLGELKMLLGLLCRETSYEEECKLFVQNIDRFLEKLLPYLQDAHGACQKLHICGNSKLEQFHRVGLIFAKKYLNKLDGAHDLICEECQFAAHELLTMVDDHDYQKEVKDFLSEKVCSHLGQYRGTCDEMLETFMPDFWQELHDLLVDNKQFCQQLQLCNSVAQVGTESSQEASSTESRKVSKRVVYHFLKN